MNTPKPKQEPEQKLKQKPEQEPKQEPEHWQRGNSGENKHGSRNGSGPKRSQRSPDSHSENPLIRQMMNRGQLWQAGRGELTDNLSHSTGYDSLNERLPAGGWPTGKLTEFLCDQQGYGEWQLLLPVLANQSQKGWVILVNPPHTPYAPALQQAGVNLDTLLLVNAPSQTDQLWVMEQALHSGSCAAVVCWPDVISPKQLRRLQLACAHNRGLAFLYRASHFAQQNSPAHLRLRLRARCQSIKTVNSILSGEQLLEVEIIKRPNGWACAPFTISMRQFDHYHSTGQTIHSIDLVNFQQNQFVPRRKTDEHIPI